MTFKDGSPSTRGGQPLGPCAPLPRVAREGAYVRLEPLDADRHGADLARHVLGHDAVWTYLMREPPADAATYRDYLADLAGRNGAIALAVIDRADGETKGHLNLMEMRPAHGVWEVGNITFSPALQRTRVATEAIHLCGLTGFEASYRRFEWKCNDRNEPSKRAALRFGFTPEGVFRQHMVVKGQNRDTAWFSIIDTEWPAIDRAFRAWLDPSNFDEAGLQRRSLAVLRNG